jgi:RNA-directed DNA polymerase
VRLPSATQLVICCKRGAEETLSEVRQIMRKLRLRLNEEKTLLRAVPEEYFNFLGYPFGRRRLIRSLHELTDHRRCLLDAAELVNSLNRKLRGWANYFKLGPVSKAYRAVDTYTTTRQRRWLRHNTRSALAEFAAIRMSTFMDVWVSSGCQC